MFSVSLAPGFIFMAAGFLLSLYTCVSNDVIQTLGTYLSANREKPFWILWIFSGTVLVLTFSLGWYFNDGDMAFGRLARIPYAETFSWQHVLPPLILIFLTKKGIPASTTFLILSVFSSGQVIGLMLAKSFFGYFLSFMVSILVYFIISRPVEKAFLYSKNKKISKGWHAAKWVATAYLWSQWLMQDAENLFVYLPRHLTLIQMIISVLCFAMLLGIVCYRKGGEIQSIVQLKTNTQDVRSATIIDIIYATILLYFQNVNNIPMSTTWVFIGLLAGREIAMYNRLRFETQKKVYKHVLKDLLKTLTGLGVSIFTVLVINHFGQIKELILHYISL